jgi:hypothetical protein
MEHIPYFVPFRKHSFLVPFRTHSFSTFSEHIPCLACRTSCTRRSQTHTHPFSIPHPRDAALHRAPRGRTAATSFCRTRQAGGACSRAHLTPLRLCLVTAWSTTASTTRPRRPSKTPLAAASASPSSKRPRCATPPPDVPTPDLLDSPATPTTASPTSPSSDSARASPTASPTPPPALRAPSKPPPAPRAASSPTLACLARRRAAQRWSALVSAPGSRLARQMRLHLGTELWNELVEHVNQHYTRRLVVRVFACVGRAALRGHPRRRAVHARGAVVDLRAGTGTGVWGGSARSVRPSSGCTWTTRGRCTCDVSPVARGNARGVAVVGRRTGRRGTVHATACLAWGLARRTVPLVCGFGAVSRATLRV